jgi:hypothetical protein
MPHLDAASAVFPAHATRRKIPPDQAGDAEWSAAAGV